VAQARANSVRSQAGPLLSIVCLGLWATSFGPALPFFARDFGTSLGTAGLLLTALFVGSISASSVLAFAMPQADSRKAALLGLAGASFGMALLAIAPGLPAGLAGAVLLGFGDGLVVSSAHQLVADTAIDVAGEINRLNVFFAAGAVAGPLWAGAILQWRDDRSLVYAGIIAVAVASAWLMVRTPAAPHRAHVEPPERAHDRGTSRVPIASVTMGAVLFFYVAAEIGLGSWVASYAKDAVGAGVMTGATLTALYWAALGGGRLISGNLFRRGRATTTVLAGSCAGALLTSSFLALTTGHLATAVIAAAATGLLFGPIWPAAIAAASESDRVNTAALVTAGNAGGIALPWLQGVVLVSAGAARGIAVTAALCVVMTALSAWFARRGQTLARRA
jgi:fucose permease